MNKSDTEEGMEEIVDAPEAIYENIGDEAMHIDVHDLFSTSGNEEYWYVSKNEKQTWCSLPLADPMRQKCGHNVLNDAEGPTRWAERSY